jgi:hypothetical protein
MNTGHTSLCRMAMNFVWCPGTFRSLQQDAMSLQQILFSTYIFGAEIASSCNKFATKIDVRLDIRLTSLKHVKKHDVAYLLHLAVNYKRIQADTVFF